MLFIFIAMTSNGIQILTKISGYLEKKGKLRIGSLWKKYWFVLEGRLLLYYRSKDEYEAISPCKGSINLCPPCTIKPAGSVCVFQIECRATTVTLRAENKSEQERWMQALLTAIAQSKSSPNRMSHFRYSLDDLPIPTQENQNAECKFQRQNTLPCNPITPKKDIIGRLQQIGAHTYGGSLDAITKLTPKVQQEGTCGDGLKNKTNELNTWNEPEGLIVENEQYSTIQEENSLDIFLDEQESEKTLKQTTSSKNESKTVLNETYLIENDQYCKSNNIANVQEQNFVRQKTLQKNQPLYERISTDSNVSSTNENTDRRRKSSNLYERISDSSSSSEKQPKICDQYSVVKKKSQESLQKEPEYSTPINLEDYNKNSLIVENDQYLQDLDNEYSKVDSAKELEELYEDPDVLRKTINFEQLPPPRISTNTCGSSEDSCSQSLISETKNKRSKGLQMLAQLIKFDRRDERPNNQSVRSKKKRSTSFIHRMLRRKAKSVDSGEDFEYDIVDYSSLEKPKDINDVQMLQELQRILEARKTVLQKKLNVNDMKTKEDKCSFTKTYEKNGVLEDETTQTVHVIIEERPSLPPRQSLQSTEINTTDSLNPVTDEVELIIKENKVRTIDEIIKDLDEEKRIQESKLHKVKDLIEKFNDLQNEDEVLLRKKYKETLTGTSFQTFSKLATYEETESDSDELTRLLEELSKVTSAPVLTPGVTCSLTTPILTDDEWLQLIPIRRRRLSDPDYDVPRPHRSLQLQNRSKQLPENAIPATRFFGPVLTSSDKTTAETPPLTSMDPDSLEIEGSSSAVTHTQPLKFLIKQEKDCSISSYTSHNYSRTDEVIYVQPKSILINMKTNQNRENNLNDTFTKSMAPPTTDNEETYVDSLEPLTESSTAF